MMNPNIIYKIVAFEDEKEIFSEKISFEMLKTIVSNSPDSFDQDPLYRLTAQHPSASIREEIAYKDKISEEVCEILSKDNSISVLRNLTRSSGFKEFASFEILERLIELDYECAENIASNIESYQQVDVSKLAEFIFQQEDPRILLSLANCYSAPKRILKQLANNDDYSISNAAKETLNR